MDAAGRDGQGGSAPGDGRPADLAGKTFWEGTWQAKGRPGVYDPRNYSNRRFHEFFARHLAGAAGKTVLEVGCAQSSWLPYFRACHGCRIVGIDYSPTGCAMARQALDAAGVPGEILERDLFGDNRDLEGTADVLFSYGFVEHFDDTVAVLLRMRALLKAGGTIITIVPNFVGWTGAVQRAVNPAVYRMHVLLDLPRLSSAHAAAGFREVEAGYFGSIASEVVKYPVPNPLRLRIARKILKKATKACWLLFRATGRHPESRRLSPYIVYVGRLPG